MLTSVLVPSGVARGPSRGLPAQLRANTLPLSPPALPVALSTKAVPESHAFPAAFPIYPGNMRGLSLLEVYGVNGWDIQRKIRIRSQIFRLQSQVTLKIP